MVFQHAFHQNLPPHCIDPLDGKSYFSKQIELKALQLMSLVESLDLRKINFNEADCSDAVMDYDEEEEEDDDEQFDEEEGGCITMASFVRSCARINAILNSILDSKHFPLSQKQVSLMIVKIITLLCATLEQQDNGMMYLHMEQIGVLLDESLPHSYEKKKDEEAFDPTHPFALPAPARDTLLSAAIALLSITWFTRSTSLQLRLVSAEGNICSDAAMVPKVFLIIPWEPLLQLLLRTVPMLDELSDNGYPDMSHTRKNSIVKKTSSLIEYCRYFFDQHDLFSSENETRPRRLDQRLPFADTSAKQIWTLLQYDLTKEKYTNATFRALVLLHLFLPTVCSAQFYTEVMPIWMECWLSVDRCNDFDFIWLGLFCRSRKFVPPTSEVWPMVRRKLLSQCGYWLQIPVTGASDDRSFPTIASMKSRGVPGFLKTLVGGSSPYQDGVDFVEKLATLLVFCLGKHDNPQITNDDDDTNITTISNGTADIIRFLSFVGPYFNPTNSGAWTFPLGVILNFLCSQFSRRIGAELGQRALSISHPTIAENLIQQEPYLAETIPDHEIPIIIDALLPLCNQSIYSKNSYVGKAGEAGLLALVQISPKFMAPYFFDFAQTALDVSSINLSHQAPSALGVLERLLQPSLRRIPSMILQRLPHILSLTLLGIDSNDRRKTIATLTFYHSVTSWLPIGSVCSPNQGKKVRRPPREGRYIDGTVQLQENLMEYIEKVETSKGFLGAVGNLPEGTYVQSLKDLGSEIDENERTHYEKELFEETALFMGDWALDFLDRVYDLLRAAGMQEKVNKNHLGASVRHTTSDAQQSKSFSRLLTVCLISLFSAMDDKIYRKAVQSVCQFLMSETLPFAAKDSSSLCKAIVVAKDDGYGLNALVPLLTQGLTKLPIATATYRVRCLSGAMKYAGPHLLLFSDSILSSIEFALSVKDDEEQKKLFKAGCKLLKHSLASQVEAIPLHANFRYQTSSFGKSAELHEDPIDWLSPTGTQLDFAVDLLERVTFSRLRNLFLPTLDALKIVDRDVAVSKIDTSCDIDSSSSRKGKTDEALQKHTTSEWRTSLKILKYSLRGVIGILFDNGIDCSDDGGIKLYLSKLDSILNPASQRTKETLQGLRGKLCALITFFIGAVSHEAFTQPTKDNFNDISSVISFDTKICKEIIEVANILLIRRGAHTKGWQARTGQQESLQDDVLTSEAGHIASAFERGSVWASNESFLFRDGEDGGKVTPRCLLVYKVWSFYLGAQRSASYAIPRALRKGRAKSISPEDEKQVLFSMQMNLDEIRGSALSLLNLNDRSPEISALDAYEGLIDGLVALTCHPKLHVRSSAMGALESGLSRFGFFARPRIPRLLQAIQLSDDDCHGKYGVPSCYRLSCSSDPDGKKKRLSDAIKGVCAIISNPRIIRHALASEETRFRLIQTLCGTQYLLSLLPREELQKTLHFFQTIFGKFRSQWHALPLFSVGEREVHRECLSFLLSRLMGGIAYSGDDKSAESVNLTPDTNSIHWRNQLLTSWFLLHLTSPYDAAEESLGRKLWATTFNLIEKNMGQPIQRVALGLLGRLVTLAGRQSDGNFRARGQFVIFIQEKLLDESVCRTLSLSLALNHRQDTESGGGNRAQWSAGIEEILRDAGANLSPAIFFPFSKDQLSSGIFKMQHAQLIQSLLMFVDYNIALSAAKNLLLVAKELLISPPNEDQKNKQSTAWEIFAGILRALLLHSSKDNNSDSAGIWPLILDFLDDVLPSLPIDMSCAVCDALRFGIYGLPSNEFDLLTQWISSRLESFLWQPVGKDDTVVSDCQQATVDILDMGAITITTETKSSLDGFASQSKWLHLLSAVLVEIRDHTNNSVMLSPLSQLRKKAKFRYSGRSGVRCVTFPRIIHESILPRLLNAAGHPYDRCRDRIAGCLYRICQIEDSLAFVGGKSLREAVLTVFSSSGLESSNFKEKLFCLITARKFVSYSLHKGEVRNDYPAYILPLIPTLFTTLKVAEDDGAFNNISASDRALEAEVAKDSRHMLSAISSCQITYSRRDIACVLSTLEQLSKHDTWQIRQAVAHFLRCFHGCHKFIFTEEETTKTAHIVANLLSDERREVSSAAMAALTGILAVTGSLSVSRLVSIQITLAHKSLARKKKKKLVEVTLDVDDTKSEKEKLRAKNQQSSVFFLCAVVLSRPYDTPPFVPLAIEALSKHSYESRAPLTVRDAVKKCFSEFKRTHMTDNWELHRMKFTHEQLLALEDVVSTPHYYA